MCCTFRNQDPDPPDPKPPASGAQIYELSDKASAHFPADSAMQIVCQTGSCTAIVQIRIG